MQVRELATYNGPTAEDCGFEVVEGGYVASDESADGGGGGESPAEDGEASTEDF